MKVKITNGSGWYIDKVGEVFEVYLDLYIDEYVFFLEEERDSVINSYIELSDCIEYTEVEVLKEHIAELEEDNKELRSRLDDR